MYTFEKVTARSSVVLDGSLVVFKGSHVAAADYLARYVARVAKNAADDAECAAQSRVFRLATARAYMVRRCRREMARGWQLKFAF